MIKSQLIRKLCDTFSAIPEKDLSEGVNQVLDYMRQSLASGKRIEIRGFGSFSLHHRPPRNAHNPKTGEKVITKAKYSPHFKPGKSLRERVDESKGTIAIQEDDPNLIESDD